MPSLAPDMRYERMNEPTVEGKNIIDVGYRECRFPIGEQKGTTMFCAESCDMGMTYCHTHLDKMYQPRKGTAPNNRPFVLPK